MILTKKIGIYPSFEQEKVLLALSEKCRLIYNFALAERREWWDRNKDLLKDDIMLRFLSHQPPVNGEPPKEKFLRGLHRHTAPRVPEAAVDSMEAPPFMAG